MSDIRKIREAIIAALPIETTDFGVPTDPRFIYIPLGHEKSLRLYSSLIVGSRGVGKTFWTTTLADPDLRNFLRIKIPELENTEVYKGFGNYKNPDASNLTPEVIGDLLNTGFTPREIWQTVIMRWLKKRANVAAPDDTWRNSIIWVRKNQELWIDILNKANNNYIKKNQKGLILFDALDRTCDNWIKIDEITSELLRVVLRLKEYTNLNAKVFLREDQFKRNIINFPDASKITATQTELTWQLHDLHGLLWQRLCNAPGEHGEILRNVYKKVMGKQPGKDENIWILDDAVRQEGDKQQELFKELAGQWMGKGPKRGSTYTWPVSHLADGNHRTSPRSFLAEIKTAADDSLYRDSDYPLHYESIKKGVQGASSNRINELNEDNPWVKDIVSPLQGQIVPLEFDIIETLWQKEYPDGYKPKGLPPEHLSEGWMGIKRDLIQLGVFNEMYDGRINMPDLYRIGFKLGRKGGVKPVK